MESKFPIPTDNIFKFMALFGLVVMVTSMSLMIYENSSTNQTVLSRAIAIYDLEASEDAHKEEKSALLLKEIEVAAGNGKIFRWSLAFMFAIGLYVSIDGFRRWYSVIQPIHDDILDLQKQKLELEVAALKRGTREDE